MGHQIKTADTSDSGLNVGISDVDSDSHADGLNSPADIPVTSWQEPGLMVWGMRDRRALQWSVSGSVVDERNLRARGIPKQQSTGWP